MRAILPLLSLALALAACGSTSGAGAPDGVAADSTAADTAAADTDAAAIGCGEPERAVTFTTSDGVRLAADWRPAAAPGAPAVVLLHMVPPANDRANYPAAFRELLAAKGLAVLNVDRRGAGDSEGSATAAYTGPDGKRDVEAAVAFLAASGCPTDAARTGLVGASNGSTSVLDYTVAAAAGAVTGPVPAAIVFLTGGSYTENQNAVADHRAVLDAIPIRFVFSTAERAWSAAFAANAPAAWVFDEYDPGDHGTRMFAARPEAMTAVADFLAATLAP
ncbi:MAG: hypothetical protein H6745_03825 [Deltaproteobacteria bacterium]|nr:hypothetical protein [Deltaproteobacteria bacterium]